jgi:hypothetical protein
MANIGTNIAQRLVAAGGGMIAFSLIPTNIPIVGFFAAPLPTTASAAVITLVISATKTAIKEQVVGVIQEALEGVGNLLLPQYANGHGAFMFGGGNESYNSIDVIVFNKFSQKIIYPSNMSLEDLLNHLADATEKNLHRRKKSKTKKLMSKTL